MIDIRGLAYVVVETTDIAGWRNIGENVLGMSATETDGGLAFKMDERAQRILALPGETNRYFATGWEVAGQPDFVTALECLARSGTLIHVGTPEETASRKVQSLAWFLDPSGNRQELVWGFQSDFARFDSPQGVARFVTGPLGMGHTVLPAPNFDETYAFYTEVMGFGLADILIHRPPGADKQRIYFLHCNNGRHHSLALFEGEVPSGCVHLMVEVESMDEVGRAYDRMRTYGAKLMCTLGRHVNDEMISFYFATPSGFAMEFGYGGRVVDWDRHIAFESTAVSLWGHDFSVGFG